MKNITLSIAALLFAATTVMAGTTPVAHAKKAKQATCTSCSKDKCTKKANCPNPTAKCVCK